MFNILDRGILSSLMKFGYDGNWPIFKCKYTLKSIAMSKALAKFIMKQCTLENITYLKFPLQLDLEH